MADPVQSDGFSAMPFSSGGPAIGASASRRQLLGQATGLATLAALGVRPAHAAVVAGDYSADQIAARDAANVAASAMAKTQLAPRYQPFSGGIVHFFGYGQSLSGGYHGVPVLSTTQPYDNLMIGQQTRSVVDAQHSTTWVPVGSPDASGTYPFEPMVATPQNKAKVTSGETPGEGAMNFLRRAYLQQMGVASNSNCRFVLTNCSSGGNTVAQLDKGASPEVFNRLRDAANAVKATAAAQGLSYQVGGMIWTQGEQDVEYNTSYAAYLADFQALQQSFLTDIVQAIGGQPPGVVVPWFCHQPDSSGNVRTTAVHQALLDWSNTPGSDLYLAGPVYQYPNFDVHLTANGYRWHANQVGKAMVNLLLGGQYPQSLYVTGATFSGTTILVNLNVPAPPVMLADAYSQFTNTAYPNSGLIVRDSGGVVPVTAVTIVGQATLQIALGRALLASPTLQAGYNLQRKQDWGTNFCDSDATLAGDAYLYTAGVQTPAEAISTWNGAPLIGQPYPLNNYLAVGTVPVVSG